MQPDQRAAAGSGSALGKGSARKPENLGPRLPPARARRSHGLSVYILKFIAAPVHPYRLTHTPPTGRSRRTLPALDLVRFTGSMSGTEAQTSPEAGSSKSESSAAKRAREEIEREKRK